MITQTTNSDNLGLVNGFSQSLNALCKSVVPVIGACIFDTCTCFSVSRRFFNYFSLFRQPSNIFENIGNTRPSMLTSIQNLAYCMFARSTIITSCQQQSSFNYYTLFLWLYNRRFGLGRWVFKLSLVSSINLYIYLVYTYISKSQPIGNPPYTSFYLSTNTIFFFSTCNDRLIFIFCQLLINYIIIFLLF